MKIMSSFQTVDLSDQDTLQGQCLNELQKAVIQNTVVTIAEQILALEFDPNNPQKFVQDDAHLKGQMAALKYILETAEIAEKETRALIQQQQFIDPTGETNSNAYGIFQTISKS